MYLEFFRDFRGKIKQNFIKILTILCALRISFQLNSFNFFINYLSSFAASDVKLIFKTATS